MKTSGKIKVIGMMSGTSLDGLDIALCTFTKGDRWRYSIEKAATVKYSPSWKSRLATAHTLSGEALIGLDVEYGKYLGTMCARFIRQHGLKADFISSHGHTVFHQPKKGFTLQIGNGSAIHSVTGLPVIYDFRSLDVMLGGEGAPLVPAGDKFLFHDYDVCLNMGGIANISTDIKKQRIAYDVCFCNTPLNHLAAKAGKEIDRGGALASRGKVNSSLMGQLSKVYRSLRRGRPSLGREIFEKRIQPLLERKDISVNDRLSTCVESAAVEIVSAISAHRREARVLCTGGGAFNSFLMARMLEHCPDGITLVLPEENVIRFKEAAVFAFLGVLRLEGHINCLKSVTRASRDSSGGVMAGFQLA